jgi:hypothetical protein
MQTLIETLIQSECHYGELAAGPKFVIDLRLVPTPVTSSPATSSPATLSPATSSPATLSPAIYQWVEDLYRETPLADDHAAGVCSTLERDRTSEYWNAEEDDRDITREEFLPWLQECFLAEEFYDGSDGENPYVDQVERLMMFASWVAPELFGESSALVIHSLTDVNNENTPYGVFVAIGPVNALVVVTCWML